jgi:hypothetical protein
MVVLAAPFIVSHADTRPVIKDIAQARVATITHENLHFLPALTRHGGNSPVGTQGVIVSALKRL